MDLLEKMIGKVFVSVTGIPGDDEMIFTAEDGSQFKFYHLQDCCESVAIEDVVGDLSDLVGSPLLKAEEVKNHPHEKEWEDSLIHNEYGGTETPDGHYLESYTWTFYKFATIKGYVDVRWFGQSNGYYSESVDMAEGRDGVFKGVWA
jgi:hypothetical protein